MTRLKLEMWNLTGACLQELSLGFYSLACTGTWARCWGALELHGPIQADISSMAERGSIKHHAECVKGLIIVAVHVLKLF